MKKEPSYQSLQTVRQIGKLAAIGSLFCNGMSNKYESKAPPLLHDILSPQ
jgi:hypothetical protein